MTNGKKIMKLTNQQQQQQQHSPSIDLLNLSFFFMLLRLLADSPFSCLTSKAGNVENVIYKIKFCDRKKKE